MSKNPYPYDDSHGSSDYYDDVEVSYFNKNDGMGYFPDSNSKKYTSYFFETEEAIQNSEEAIQNSEEDVANSIEDLLEDIIDLLEERQVLKNLNKNKDKKKLAFSLYESLVFEFEPDMNGIEIKIFDANSYYEGSENYLYAIYFAWSCEIHKGEDYE